MATLTALTSTTMEAGLLELIEEVSKKQASTASNPNAVQLVTAYDRDGNTGLINVSLSIPSTSAEGADGKPVITATPVFA